jgi:hypothetical protein
MTESARVAGSPPRTIVTLVATIACLALLVWMNYYLRHTLELADQHMYSFYKYFYPAQEKVIFSAATPWWKLLLPIPQFTGTWNTTTLVLMRLLEDDIKPATAWYVFNAVLIVVSFWASWAVFRSRVFSYTLAICMGFGTQLYIAYPNSGPISFPLLFAYYELLLLCAYKVITAEQHRRMWMLLFVPALLLTVLAYEGWLDLLVFFWLASAYLYVMFGRMGLPVLRRRVVGVAAVMSAVGLAYIVTKIVVGYGQTPGMESDVVFNYPSLAPAIEDYLSNAITNFYMAATNFLPPSLVSSTAFYQLGGDRLVDLQHGYHAPFSYLVPMHYLFLWRYFAGMAVAVYLFVMAHLVRRCWNEPTADRLALILCLLLMAVAGPTHNFVKFRPMNAMAVQTYHVMTGVLGAALTISLLLMRVWTQWPRWIGGPTVAFGWAVIFYGALARPGMISHQAAQSGIGVQAYPNPMAVLMTKLGRPYQLPGGLALYQLMKYSPSATPAVAATTPAAPAVPETRRFEGGVAPLPQLAPPLSQWSHVPGVSVTVESRGSVVQGDDTQMGYQLTSPPVQVTPHRTLLVRVSGTIDQGRVCIGALDEGQGHWVVPADSARQEIVVDTADNRHITIVFANCMPATPTPVPTRFTIESVSYGMLANADQNRP